MPNNILLLGLIRCAYFTLKSYHFFICVIGEKEDQISQEDLKVIEGVLTNIVDQKVKMHQEKQDLDELKEDVQDYREVSRISKCFACQLIASYLK